MRLQLTVTEQAFQREVRGFLSAHWQTGTPLAPGPRQWRAQRTYTAKLAQRGWLAGHWPIELGGAGWSDTHRLLWEREVAAACAPQPSPQGIDLLGPLLIRRGTGAQQKQHLPAIAQGKVAWSQAFAEDAAALDIDQIHTRAQGAAGPEGHRWLLSGTKSWVLDIPPAEMEQDSWLYVLADVQEQADEEPQATAPGHSDNGLGVFLVPLDAPGVSVVARPVIGDSSGHPIVHSVAFDRVALDADALLGLPGQGADLAQEIDHAALVRPGMVARNSMLFNQLQAFLKSDSLWQDADFRARLHAIEVELAALTTLESRAWSGSYEPALRLGLAARIEPLNQKLADLHVDALGYFALPFVDFSALDNEGPIGPEFAQPALLGMLSDRAREAIAAPREHLKDLIAKSVLALPDASGSQQ